MRFVTAFPRLVTDFLHKGRKCAIFAYRSTDKTLKKHESGYSVSGHGKSGYSEAPRAGKRVQSVDAVIYTRDDGEFRQLDRLLREEAELVNVYRDPLDGHGHYGYRYDLAIIALDGARGMEEMLEWSRRWPETRIIWITNDPDFAGMAMRMRISGFLPRPWREAELRAALKEALGSCGHGNEWNFPAPRGAIETDGIPEKTGRKAERQEDHGTF